MDEMIRSLPEGYRDTVRLAEIARLSQQEVANRLGLSLSGAKYLRSGEARDGEHDLPLRVDLLGVGLGLLPAGRLAAVAHRLAAGVSL